MPAKRRPSPARRPQGGNPCQLQGGVTQSKIPGYVAITSFLPKTVTGKVRKHILREQAISELGLENVASIETA